MRTLLLILPLALALAACGGNSNSSGENNSGGNSAAAGSSAGVSQTIQISEKEYSLSPSSVTVPKAGTYAFEVTNDGQTTHSLKIEASGGGKEAEAGHIEPGETETVKFTFAAGGKYEMFCPIDGHRQRGMQGTITVGGSGTGATATKPKTTTSDGGMTNTTGRYQAPGY